MKLILSFLVLCSFSTLADSLTFGVEALDYEPFYTGKGRVYNGMSQEIIDAFAKDKKHTILYNTVKIDQLYEKFLSKQVDYKYPDNPIWNKEAKTGKAIFYTAPIISTQMGLNVIADKKDIKKVGIVSGFTPWIILDDVKSGKLELVEKTSMQQLVSMASKGEVDAIYGSVDVVNFHANAINKKFSISSNFKTDTDVFHISGYNEKIINEISDWLKANTSKVTEIKNKYLKK